MRRISIQVESHSPPTRPAGRTGATLTEALVALMVMAIGVISLASLFPIAVLKTARANQLTVATNVRYNAEAMMKLYPWIFSDPNPADTGPNGLPDGNPFNDYDFAVGQAFLFDPQGLVVDVSRPISSVGSVGLLPKYGGGFNATMREADAITAGLDNWTVLHDAAATNFNAAFTQMDLVDLNMASVPAVQTAAPAAPVTGGMQLRVQIFYNGGKSSLMRMVTGFSGANTVLWTEDLNNNSMLDPGEDKNGNFVLDTHPLPAGVTYETARLESRERRYTWLLTVRPQDVGASFVGGLGAKPTFDVVVVVFFGRGFAMDSEQVYGTLPAGAPAVANLVASTTAIVRDQNSFLVSWPAGSEPNLKRGGWVLDAINGYWYQIENYSDPTVGSSTITLTSNVLDQTTLLVFPKAVVDVFPIAPQTP